jgi:protein-S-isoprenylcysteine O-methyltransferase Ste14
MKWLLNILGAMLVLIGIVWFFQGINVLLGSFMSGNSLYAFLGTILAVVGIIVLIFANRCYKAGKGGENSAPKD